MGKSEFGDNYHFFIFKDSRLSRCLHSSPENTKGHFLAGWNELYSVYVIFILSFKNNLTSLFNNNDSLLVLGR